MDIELRRWFALANVEKICMNCYYYRINKCYARDPPVVRGKHARCNVRDDNGKLMFRPK